jgi:hypothetical protein
MKKLFLFGASACRTQGPWWSDEVKTKTGRRSGAKCQAYRNLQRSWRARYDGL